MGRLRSSTAILRAVLSLAIGSLSACELIGGYQDFQGRSAGADSGKADARPADGPVGDGPAADGPAADGPPADAPLADASDSSGDGGKLCESGQIPSGDQCVPAELYVDANRGRDDYDGTELRPFKTFKKAMTVATAGQTLIFEQGVYSAASGDDLTLPIPDGVTLEQHPASVGFVTFRGNGTETLIFKGNASVVGAHGASIVFENFLSPLTANQGTQIIKNVKFSNSVGHLLIFGSAHVQCLSCNIWGRPQNGAGEAVLVRDSAVLEMSDVSSIYFPEPDQPSENDCLTNTPTGIIVGGAASLVMRQSWITGYFLDALGVGSGGFLILDRVSFDKGCFGHTMAARGYAETGRLTLGINRSSFGGKVYVGDVAHVKIRGSQFLGAEGLVLDQDNTTLFSWDLGLPPDGEFPGEPGENTFTPTAQPVNAGAPQVGLSIGGTNNLVWASGNTWAPNIQGADANGHYAVGQVISAVSGQAMNSGNFFIYDSQSVPTSQLFF